MKKVYYLILLIFISSFFRFWGLKWGLPNNIHPYSLHPDEYTFLGSLRNMNPQKLDFNPHCFRIPALHTYSLGIILYTLKSIGLIKYSPMKGFYVKDNVKELRKIYYLSKIYCAMLGICTVLILFLILAKYYKLENAFFISLIFSIAPVHVIQSHYINADVPMMFWLSIAFYFALRILDGKNKSIDYLLMTFFAATAFATKHNAIFFIIIILYVNYVDTKKILNYKLFTYLLFYFFVFLIFNPYTLLAYKEFFNDLINLNNLIGINKIKTNDISYQSFSLNHVLEIALLQGLWYPMLIFLLFSMLFSFYKPDKLQKLFLLWSFLYLGILIRFGTQGTRHTIPFVFGLVCLSAGIFNKKLLFYKVFTFITLILTLIPVIAYDKYFSKKLDFADEESIWIEQNISKSSTFGIIKDTYLPPVLYLSAENKYFEKKYEIININYLNITDLNKSTPDYFILDLSAYHKYLYYHKTYEKELKFINYLNNNFSLIKTFEIYPEFLDIKFKYYLQTDDIILRPISILKNKNK